MDFGIADLHEGRRFRLRGDLVRTASVRTMADRVGVGDVYVPKDKGCALHRAGCLTCPDDINVTCKYASKGKGRG
jgi:hypothetical protein